MTPRQFNVYKLKTGKTTGHWQLPVRTDFISKLVDGKPSLKKIIYVKGAGTIFKDEYKGDLKSENIWFVDGELVAPRENFELNEILQNHRMFNKNYELYDEEVTAQKSMDKLIIAAKATNAVLNETDEDKIKAMAMIIIDEEASNWGPTKCRSTLLEYASKNPDSLLYEMDRPNYQSRYFAALAFNKGIVKYNSHRTAVVWADSEGKIATVVPGETGLIKLGEIFAKDNDESTQIMQRIGEKINAKIKAAKTVSPDLGYSEADIRAQIEAEYKAKYEAQISSANANNQPKEKTEIQLAREGYVEVFGKEVPPNMRNNMTWLKEQIANVANAKPQDI